MSLLIRSASYNILVTIEGVGNHLIFCKSAPFFKENVVGEATSIDNLFCRPPQQFDRWANIGSLSTCFCKKLDDDVGY